MTKKLQYQKTRITNNLQAFHQIKKNQEINQKKIKEIKKFKTKQKCSRKFKIIRVIVIKFKKLEKQINNPPRLKKNGNKLIRKQLTRKILYLKRLVLTDFKELEKYLSNLALLFQVYLIRLQIFFITFKLILPIIVQNTYVYFF